VAEGDPDTRNLVDCAIKAGEHGVALEACAAFRATGPLEPYLLHRELDLLDHYDLDEGVRLLQGYVSSHPSDRLSRLRLSLLGLALDRPDLVASSLVDLPPVEEVGAVNGRPAVTVLLRSGHPNEALHYAYKLLRRNFDHPAAHQAYFSVMLGWGGTRPEIAAPLVAGTGAAVRYSEEGESRDEWAVLEDAPDASPARGEYAPDHPLVAELANKRVGDQFVLARGSAGDRFAMVLEIQSKYVFRARDSMRRCQVLFRGADGPELYRVRATTETGEERHDFGAIFASVDRQHCQIQQAEESYRSQLVPIHLFGKLTGAHTIDALFHLAASPSLPIRCCTGSIEEKGGALGALRSSEGVVLELTALGTLLLLGIEQHLRDWPHHFVVSRGTVQELRALIESRRFGRPSGRLVKVERGYAYIEQDAEAWRSELARLEALVAFLESSCEVRGCRELASLDPEWRENLVNLFGHHGAESILLASGSGHLLWTDDLALAGIAKEQFGVGWVWTQLALEARVAAGSLDESAYLDASARLVGGGYEFTSLSRRIIARAGEMAEWDANRWPLEQTLDQFANENIDLKDRIWLGSEALAELMPRADLAERRQQIVIRIAERLAAKRGGHDAVRVLARVIPSLFGQDAIHAYETHEILSAWLASSARRIIMPGPSIISLQAKPLILPGSIVYRHGSKTPVFG